MIGHKRSVHFNNEHFKCPICDKDYKQKQHVKLHMKYFNEGISSHSCTICEFKTAFKSALTSHINRTHKKIKLQCPRCDFTCSERITLTAHLISIPEGKKHIHAQNVMHALQLKST